MKRSHQRRPKAGKHPEPIKLSRKEKLLIAGLLVSMMTFLFVFMHVYWTNNATAALENRLKQWKQQYELTDDQVNRLRTIEREFHGSGNMLSHPTRTLVDERAHSETLRQVMKFDPKSRGYAPVLESP